MSLENDPIARSVHEKFGRLISHIKTTKGRLVIHTFRIHLSDYIDVLRTVDNPDDMTAMIPGAEAAYNEPKDRVGNKLVVITKKEQL